MLSSIANASFYVGTKAGAGLNTGNISILNDSDNNKEVDCKPFAQSTIAGMMFGYSKTMNSNFYSAAEAILLYNSLNSEILGVNLELEQMSTIRAHLKNHLLYGATLHLGYQRDDIIPFISLGAFAGEYQSKVQAMSDAATHKNIFGFTPGIGIKYINGKITWSAQYELLIGNKIETKILVIGRTVPQNYVKYNNQHIITLSAAYHF
jgi:hypothetical protein